MTNQITSITPELLETSKVLASEISTLHDYNRQWSEILENATDDEGRQEAANAIKTNNGLIGEKSLQVSEILNGINPFQTIETNTEVHHETLESIRIKARTWIGMAVSIPFNWIVYKPSEIEISNETLAITPSTRLLSSKQHSEINVEPYEITKYEFDESSVKISTTKIKNINIDFKNENDCSDFRKRLTNFLAPELQNGMNDHDEFINQINTNNSKAWVTPLLITFNCAIFGLMVINGYGVFSPNVAMAVEWGANAGPMTIGGEWWRLLTHSFIHFGILHIVLNMSILYQSGAFIERLLGSVRFLIIFLLSGISAGIFSLWYSPWKSGAGASGAIFGLIGAATTLALIPSLRPPKLMTRGLIKGGVTFVAINCAIGFSIPYVDNAAHLGGLVAGCIFFLLLGTSSTSDEKNKLNFNFLTRLSASIGLIFLMYLILISNNSGLVSKASAEKSKFIYRQGINEYKIENLQGSLVLLKESSDLGNELAPNMIGYMYSSGEGVQKNAEEAEKWFALGSERGDKMAMYNLAISLDQKLKNGDSKIGVYKLLIDSAELGYYPARSKLDIAPLILQAESNTSNYEVLASLIDEKAKLQNKSAIALQGWLLLQNKKSSNVDKNRGIELLKKADSLGDARAAYRLGWMSYKGNHVEANTAKAIEFFKRSADLGDPMAQLQIAKMYRDGDVFDKSENLYKKYLQLSANQGYEAAVEEMKKIGN